LAVVRNFLKGKGLTYSAGSWEDIVTKRIFPAIENHQLANDDLIELLRSVEECGHQHVFLYSCPRAKAAELLSRPRVENSIRKAGLDDLLVAPKVLDQPREPQIVDVRLEAAEVELNLTIKQVELRKSYTFTGTEQHGSQIHKLYDLVEERAVNLARFHRDGLLEIRIASLANSTKYENALRAFWADIGFLLPIDEFSELSLAIVKERLWTERADLGDLIRHSDSTIRDEEGNILRAATGSDRAGLGVAVGQSLDHLLETDENAYCDGANIWFKKSDSLSTDTHVLLGGESNEFALPAHCSEEDYKYVLSKLRSFNKRVP
jgi:hypothetical protein